MCITNTKRVWERSNDTYYITKNVENAYYCAPIVLEDGLWDDLAGWMGLVEIHMGQENALMADPYKGFCDVTNKKMDNDAGLNEWLELQEQAKAHDRLVKELVASPVEDQQRSIQAEASNGKWGPQKWDPTNKPTRW